MFHSLLQQDEKFLTLMHMMSVCVEGSYESSKDFIRDILDFRTLIE